MKDKYTVSKITAIEWFRLRNNSETSLEDQQRSGRPSSTLNIETLLRWLVKQQPQSSTCRLSAELAPLSPLFPAILIKSDKWRRRCWEVPHELTGDQQQQDDLSTLVLNCPKILLRIVISAVELLLVMRSWQFIVMPPTGRIVD